MKKIILIIFITLFSRSTFSALNASACANLVKTEIANLNPSAGSSPYVLEYWTAICKGIIDHIKAAAEVTNNGSCNVTSGSSTGTWPATSTGVIQ